MQVIQTVSRATVYMNYIMFGSLHKEHEIFFMIPLRGKVIYSLPSSFFYPLSLHTSHIILVTICTNAFSSECLDPT